MMNGSTQLSTVVTATLSAELKGSVPADFVADIVRAVLDENRLRPQSGRRCSRLGGVWSASSALARLCSEHNQVTRTTSPIEDGGSGHGCYPIHQHGRNRS